MVVEAFGAWGAEAMGSLSHLASRLATSPTRQGQLSSIAFMAG